eukprot:TRINITY_DN1012_c0_g1_i1.p1 TRINITY_DN1012_c0_g1~~TRINITY_DN1012_c0_g1_i1.p1  ORF type:complete len:106 (+),score=3.63 TRINITY_DN1012_c0_g1_i1:347-664(+)
MKILNGSFSPREFVDSSFVIAWAIDNNSRRVSYLGVWTLYVLLFVTSAISQHKYVVVVWKYLRSKIARRKDREEGQRSNNKVLKTFYSKDEESISYVNCTINSTG